MGIPIIGKVLETIGNIGGSLINRNKNNTAIGAADKQRDLDYEDALRQGREHDARKSDGIDYLKAIAQSKGFKIPTQAFDSLLSFKGRNQPVSARERFVPTPKQGVGSAI